jgi:phospholipid/cholesterol/gamma-HCH transport system substrate-binding protein
MSSEFKVGVLVLMAIVVLFYMSFRVGKYGTLTRSGYEVVVHLPDVAGLDIKSPVELAGVEIGAVHKLSLDEYRAKASLLIKDNVKIPTDSKLVIRSFGILGDKYLAIVPGQAKTFLKPGDEITNVVAVADYDQMFRNVQSAAENFSDVMGQFKGMIGDQEKSNLKESLQNIKVVSGEFKEMVTQNKTNVTRIVSNVAQASDKFGPLADKADAAFTGINSIVRGVEEGKGSLGLLVKDETLYNDARDTVASLKTISAEIEQGKGTLGKLVKDEMLYTDAEATMKSIKEMTESMNKGQGTLGKLMKDDTLATEAEKTMKKVQRAADSVQEQVPITVLGTIFGILF